MLHGNVWKIMNKNILFYASFITALLLDPWHKLKIIFIAAKIYGFLT